MQLNGIVQNTAIWYIEIYQADNSATIVDKEWRSILNISPVDEFIKAYKAKMIAYATEGTREYNLTLDSVLSGLYYQFKE